MSLVVSTTIAMVICIAGAPRPGWSCWVFDHHNCQLERGLVDSRVELWFGCGERPNIVETAVVFITRSGPREISCPPHGSWSRLEAPQPGFGLRFDYAGRDAYQVRYLKQMTAWHCPYTHPMRVERGFGDRGVDYQGREIFMKFLRYKTFHSNEVYAVDMLHDCMPRRLSCIQQPLDDPDLEEPISNAMGSTS